MIRGPTFLTDKIKIPCGAPVYQLVWVDMFSMGKEERCPHVASRPESYAYLYHQHKLNRRKQRAIAAGEDVDQLSPLQPVDPASASFLSPMIIVNFMFPGPESHNMNLVLYFTRRIPPVELIQRLREKREKQKNRKKTSHPSSPENSQHQPGGTTGQQKRRGSHSRSKSGKEEKDGIVSHTSNSEYPSDGTRSLSC